MPDEYHFMRDDGSLIDARLTKDEAEALTAYRGAMEATAVNHDNVRSMILIFPVSREIAGDDVLERAKRAASKAVIRVLSETHRSTSR